MAGRLPSVFKKTEGIMKTAAGILLSLGTIMFMSASVFAQANEQTGGEKDPSGYGAWDSNTDNQIDENEFSSLFGDKDYYSQWDSNQDNMLNENEWQLGLSDTYPDNDYEGNFRDWDSNSDGYLDSDEYSTGTFGMWDENRNGYIDSDEYDRWKIDKDGN